MREWMGKYAVGIGKTSRQEDVLSHFEKWSLGFILESFLHELRMIQAWGISGSSGPGTEAPCLNEAAPWTDVGVNGGSHHYLPKRGFEAVQKPGASHKQTADWVVSPVTVTKGVRW